ncbi:hypothetical protein L596_017491 [Steinernema carpocapsae]|uniref:Uncharacterized protein n=1 Tax=Steinernema carpocapsae TaxID=34508 RepID=A0A4U5N243_STECR|nr:hypothetical protein L596_017491 [Steinernema carpocapsae]
MAKGPKPHKTILYSRSPAGSVTRKYTKYLKHFHFRHFPPASSSAYVFFVLHLRLHVLLLHPGHEIAQFASEVRVLVVTTSSFFTHFEIFAFGATTGPWEPLYTKRSSTRTSAPQSFLWRRHLPRLG